MARSTDRIVKTALLQAPRERVWRAVTDSKEFGSWFGVAFDAPFSAGAHLVGQIVPTQVDAEVAKMQEPYRGMAFECWIERIEPKRVFSFRWHPGAVDPDTDYSKEPTTLVEFVMEDHADGTKLTITESGFDRIPLARRAAAFASNEGGWEAQTALLQKYLRVAVAR